MKAALITTVLNEEDSIGKFLDSIVSQTLIPSEIIIVDAGSKDNTISIIKKYSKKLPLKLFIHKGNRSTGRNFAIKKTTSEYIAVTDVGCTLDKFWFERITTPLANNCDVVAGFYKPITLNVFEKSLATYTCVPIDKVTQDFLPSSRSVSFSKKAWTKVGGYPEHLDTCEDLVFASALKAAGLRFSVAKNALVYWQQRKNIIEASWQFYSYALGDGMAGYYRIQTPFLFGRYILLAIILLAFAHVKDVMIFWIICLLAVGYLSWSIKKNYRYVRHPYAFVYLPILQVTSDIFVIAGTTNGTLKRILKAI